MVKVTHNQKAELLCSKLYRFCIRKLAEVVLSKCNKCPADRGDGIEIIVHNHNFPEWLFDQWFRYKGEVQVFFKGHLREDAYAQVLGDHGDCQVVIGHGVDNIQF